MKNYFSFLFLAILLFVTSDMHAQVSRIDSTLKLGKAGYRVTCNNKNKDQNEVKVKPIGFDNAAREMNFYVKGRITKAEIDDLNNDGFPDLIIYVFSGANGEFGTVVAFASQENKSYVPFGMQDVMLDGKLKDGYQGHDEFILLEGKLIRQFPLYKPGDEKDKPTGGKRFVQYAVAPSGNGGFEFKVSRTYDIK
jgi:hypothetical protein